MLTLYAILIRLAVPFMVLRLLWRGRQNPAYRHRIPQRLGLALPPADVSAPGAVRIWIHAVSVGETLAIAPLIARVLEGCPRYRVLVTSTTPTGAEQVKRLFGDRVDQCWVPFDTPGSVERFLNHWRPSLVVLVETEIWPQIILRSRALGVSTLLINARLSARSARGYGRVAPLAKPVLASLSHIACQQTSDARRFRALGVSIERLSVAGSIKFDVPVTDLARQRDRFAETIGVARGRRVLVAASTHPGEEIMVLESFASLVKESAYGEPRAAQQSSQYQSTETQNQRLLILAPRHPERVVELAGLLDSTGFKWTRRSALAAATPLADVTQVLVLDTLGELAAATGLADVVFVGGSLIRHGGHNPLEAAAFGIPVITGPHTFNFQGIYRDMVHCNAVLSVVDSEGLLAGFNCLLGDDALRDKMGQAAADYLAANRGALERQFDLICRSAER